MRLKNLLIPAVASLALLTACNQGGAGPSPTPTPTTNGVENLAAEEILDRATDALLDARSFRISGSGEVDGDEVTIEALFAGGYIDGEFMVPVPGVGTMNFQVITTAGGAYIRAGDELWSAFLPEDALPVVLPMLSGKYVKVPAGSEDELVLDPADILSSEGPVTKGTVTDYKGQQVIELLDDSDGKLYVALVGEPYPLAIVAPEGTFEFLEIDADVTVTAPPAAEVFDLEALQGLAG